MSRALQVICLLAVVAAPLLAQAEAAEGLAASLAELLHPNVIEPVSAPDADGVSAALRSVAPLDLTPLEAAIVTVSPRHVPSVRPLDSDRGEVPPWPFPTRERRLSWLQALLI
jgi:hypothetical protein